jgi:signal transduction histidine kinase
VRIGASLAGDQVELRVMDSGAGVAPEMREKIFERFVQVEGGKVSRSGHGLGLAFCKLAVEAHGGKIWVEDAQPGAQFVIRLPHV